MTQNRLEAARKPVLMTNATEMLQERCEAGIEDKQSVNGLKMVLRQEGRWGSNDRQIQLRIWDGQDR
jgi:hypothetical protein